MGMFISMTTVINLHSVFLILLINMAAVLSDPQTVLLREDCTKQSLIRVEMSVFMTNFNKTFAEIRRKLSNNHNIRFATTVETDVYGMVQCRNYLSSADCVACLDVARIEVRRNCPTTDGGHVIYKGCFLRSQYYNNSLRIIASPEVSLRYESYNFYTNSLLVSFEASAGVIYKGCFLRSQYYNNSLGIIASPEVSSRYESYNFYTNSLLVSFEASAGICSRNQSKLEAAAFTPVVEGIITDLVAATPKINGYFAATTRPVSSGGVTAKIYAAAQCVETISQKDCHSCLTIGYNNLQNCPPGSEGSSADAGCFLRYSDASFFADNSIINITPYLQGGDMFGLSKLQGPVIYSFKDLKSATRNFSEDSKIGEGGYGDVYKGIIKNGDVVAVKKLSIGTSKAKEDFESEVRLIININHRNIIRLLGCSRRGPDLLLVFEYMANGSLDTFLYGVKRGLLSWKQRVDIILGIARGLVYLHEQFHKCIIHRDIKSSNILLDDEFQPKIADFGLARLIRDDQSHLTTRFAGTLGYTAPEYAIHGHLSEKVDTYSFGIVVLEIVGGRRCTSLNIKPDNRSLLEHTWNLYSNDMHSDLVDDNIAPNEYNIDNVEKIIEIALMCTQSPTSVRPTMSEVVVLLTSDSSIKQKPGKPTLF